MWLRQRAASSGCMDAGQRCRQMVPISWDSALQGADFFPEPGDAGSAEKRRSGALGVLSFSTVPAP